MHIEQLFVLFLTFIIGCGAGLSFCHWWHSSRCLYCEKKVKIDSKYFTKAHGGGVDRVENFTCDQCGCRATRKTHYPGLWSDAMAETQPWEVHN